METIQKMFIYILKKYEKMRPIWQFARYIKNYNLITQDLNKSIGFRFCIINKKNN